MKIDGTVMDEMNVSISEAVSEEQCNCHRMKRTPGYRDSFPLSDVGAICNVWVVSDIEFQR